MRKYQYQFYVSSEYSDFEARYVDTKYFETDEEADNYGFILALEEYQKCIDDENILFTWNDCYAELLAQNLEEPTEEEVNEMYYEEVENHITFYWAKLEN